MADSKIDPFDVAALEKSLNDSATRVSTIWVSFLTFSLYLLTAATTVTHRQLFLAEPIKLPVLNIELPLWGFFFLAPILFVILHAYVLIQVILLARTAATYNEAVENAVKRDNLSLKEDASLRQRLANTLFAQIFAGSPRERAGWLGWLLKAMAWITLAIAPILILLTFQFMFLPYHSHLATWTHRLLILMELAAVFWLWPLVLDPRQDFEWFKIWRQIRRASTFPRWLLAPWDQRRLDWRRLRHNAVPVTSCLLFVLISLAVATFPGEPHVNIVTAHSWSSVQCDRWFARKFAHLNLARVDVVEDDKLKKLAAATSEKGLKAYEGERTLALQQRDLRCGTFKGMDLRRADLSEVKADGANFDEAELQGAYFGRAAATTSTSSVAASLIGASFNSASMAEAFFDDAVMTGARFNGARLQGASMKRALMHNVSLENANAQGVSFQEAQIQGGNFFRAKLQGAQLSSARLQGANLRFSELQGASFLAALAQTALFENAILYGASLDHVNLNGASLRSARLQGASLTNAQMVGTQLDGAWLQGADLRDANLKLARLQSPWLWHSNPGYCFDAHILYPNFKNVLATRRQNPASREEEISATAAEIDALIERVLETVPNDRKNETQMRMREKLSANRANTEHWRTCAAASDAQLYDDYHKNLAAHLRDLVCDAVDSRKAIAHGAARIWLRLIDHNEFKVRLAKGWLGKDGKRCLAMEEWNTETRSMLEGIIEKGVEK